jgi:hypothetical protein
MMGWLLAAGGLLFVVAGGGCCLGGLSRAGVLCCLAGVVVGCWVATIREFVMKQFRPLGLVLLVVFAFGAVVAASASARKATPEILPIAGFTDKSGPSALASPGLFGSTNTVACAKSVSTGAFQTSLLGTFDVLFEKCLLSSILGLFLCTGLGDTANSSSILVLGTFHLRYRELGTSAKTVVAFLIKVVHFACVRGEETRLVLVRGCAAGEITPVNTPIKLPTPFVMKMTKEAAHESHNEITKIASETGTTLETCKLESSEDPGTTWEQSAEATEDEIFPKSSPAEIMA